MTLTAVKNIPMSKKTKENEPVIKKTQRKLPCQFTDQEKLRIGSKMGEHLNEIQRLQNALKEVSQDYKAKITSEEAQLDVAKNNLQLGYEHREIECLEHMDTPEKNRKTVIRQDTGAEVCVESMSFDEKNPPLPLTDPVPAGQPLASVKEAMKDAVNEIPPAAA